MSDLGLIRKFINFFLLHKIGGHSYVFQIQLSKLKSMNDFFIFIQ